VRTGATGRRGRTHRTDRRHAEIAYLRDRGVRLVVSLMRTRHNLADYEAAGVASCHIPVAEAGEEEALDRILPLLKRELRSRGAVAVHGDLRTDVVTAVCAAHVHQERGVDLAEALAAAAASGLEVSPATCALVGVELVS